MGRALPGGRISLSPTEKEVAATMFELVSRMVQDGRISEDELLEAARGNMHMAEDVRYPARALHDDSETNEEWGDVEKARDEYIRSITPQEVADVAADFGVRLPLEGVYCRKWADKAPKE